MSEQAIVRAEQTAIVPANDSGRVLEIISRVAADPSADIDKLERLMALHERLEKAKAEQAFNASMTDAQSEMGRISTDATNPQTRSRYATYGQLDKHLRPIYTRHGFALSFDEADSPKGIEWIRVLCYVSHSGGFSKTYHRDVPIVTKGLKGNDMMTPTHANAAAQSYGMRYLLKAIFNVAIGEDDNDGNGAAPEPTLTPEQVASLDKLLKDTGSDKAKFLAHIKVDSLDQVLAKNFDSVAQTIRNAAAARQRKTK